MKWVFIGMLLWTSPEGYDGEYYSQESYLEYNECVDAMVSWYEWADEFEELLVNFEASCTPVEDMPD
jgi:hypothetical protein